MQKTREEKLRVKNKIRKNFQGKLSLKKLFSEAKQSSAKRNSAPKIKIRYILKVNCQVNTVYDCFALLLPPRAGNMFFYFLANVRLLLGEHRSQLAHIQF